MKFLSPSEKLKLFWKATINMSYITGNKKLAPPITAWRLTQRCNLTCKHCTSYLNRDKIETEKVMSLAHKIADSDTMIVILTGGEPLLVPNIKEIITLLKQKGKIVKINTNGYNLEDMLDFMIESGVDSVTVSIDGADAQTHDDIRGKKGSFEKAVENLKYLKEHRISNKPFIAVRGVLMKENFNMVPDYIALFEKLVDEIHFQPIHDNLAHHQVVDGEMLFTGNDKKFENDFGEMMNNLMKEKPEFDNAYYRNFSKFLFHPDRMEELALHSCLAIWMNFFNVTEDGTCLSCSQTIGNLYQSDVETIWNSDARMGFLRSIARFGKCKIPCWLNCTGVAPDLIGNGIKAMLQFGSISDKSRSDFMQMPQYTGRQTSFAPPNQLEHV